MKKILFLIVAISLSFFNCCLGQTNKMPLRTIKKLNLQIPFLGLGTVELGRDWGIGGKNSLLPEEKIVKEVLLAAMKSQWLVIDTASSYQMSEERIGRYLPQSKYHYLLITKPGEHSIKANDPRCKQSAEGKKYCDHPKAAYDFSRKAIYQDVENSLKNLKVKTLDVVLLHLENEKAQQVLAKGEAIKALEDLRAANKIKYIGVSVNGSAALTAAKMKNLDFLETEFSLINQKNAEAIKTASENGMGVIVRGGLGTGLLTKYVASHLNESNLPYGETIRALVKLTNYNYDKLTSLALAFLYQNPHISTVIIGADRPEFIKKDSLLLENFKDQALLESAKKLVANLKTPNNFTENMGEYYVKDINKDKSQIA